MPTIRPLPQLVVNQIAAGEVVERPASVVKELLENAVDSGATRIDVAIEEGGAGLVRIVDNGCGIGADELHLAVTNHATSKIASAEELFRVGTLGFRGEALASIASVSRLVIRSRQEGCDGAELVMSGSATADISPAGCPVGTTVEVRDLFFNTPVRRKFLRTAQTEAGHVSEAFARVALAHPSRHFTLSHNGRLLHDLPPCPAPPEEGEDRAWRDRIAALFGEDLSAALIAVESRDERTEGLVRLSGFVADPKETRTHTRMQYLLVNGRAIRDRSLQHALGEAYRGLILTGRKPICFLRLEMPPALVDVNVHPQKLEVRFADSGPLYSQLLGTLRSRFLSSDLRVGASNHIGNDEDDAVGDATSGLVDWAKNELGERQRRFDDSAPMSYARHTSGGSVPAFRPFPSGGESLSMHRFMGPRAASSPTAAEGESVPMRAAVGDDAAHAYSESDDNAAPVRALQLHNRYLIVETDAGMEVIDQHALHERVLYEQLRTRVLAGPLETQKLLVPEPVDLSPAEAAAVLDARELLLSVGLDVRAFGGDTVLVHSFPAMLRRLTPGETLRDLAAQLASEAGKAPDARDVLDELLHTMSCKAAVKYGDPLSDEEIAALLAARPATENHHHCPHGRPTSLVFTREELDRRFQRI
ncbi:DNA mismatch repair endonuclease MutL [Botrimarina mediterranea]|uniref:DNA mismatch repair protein MutL n=1 Tax=Botrimarina mediterranea TaxID=2528022 RepID=A0A518KB32_9BACT|nr:DNA mismatch repair endonuclease MutL [Botrimarina mediterranea]QDV74989.1 DNA mismatch repair protein MutL [Botrimarina mediterranea]QDV79636.1 DNA mismatch repair protein MutL [Planctomycetes bacterium K2D]